jgi:hypothetical protein
VEYSPGTAVCSTIDEHATRSRRQAELAEDGLVTGLELPVPDRKAVMTTLQGDQYDLLARTYDLIVLAERRDEVRCVRRTLLAGARRVVEIGPAPACSPRPSVSALPDDALTADVQGPVDQLRPGGLLISDAQSTQSPVAVPAPSSPG